MTTASAANITDRDGVGLKKTSDEQPTETLFRNTVEYAPVGIAFANRDGSYRHANQAFCATLGFTAQELVRHSIGGLTMAEDLQKKVGK